MPRRDTPCSRHPSFCILPLLFIFLSFAFIDIARGNPTSSPPRLEVNGFDINLPIFSIFLTPGEKIEIIDKNKDSPSYLKTDDRLVTPQESGTWTLNAPTDSGIYKLFYHNAEGTPGIVLNLFVTTPLGAAENATVQGYRIGAYPAPRKIKNVEYQTPKGLIAVTRKNQDMLLSPHFRLSQFLCKQKSGYPKYLVLQEELLLLLEKILAEVNRRGYDAGTFGFISAYRTPFYNRMIKNVDYSRHIYGDAADIFIDTDNDGRMDDLNADGNIDIADARILFSIAESVMGEAPSKDLVGGIGLYQPTARHAGFVHVDTRGHQARW